MQEHDARRIVNIPYFAPGWDLADAMRKSLRGMGDLSVEEMARRLGVNRNTVGNWLSGRIEPNEATLIAWSQLTAVPYAWLLRHKSHVDALRGRFGPEEMDTIRQMAFERGVTVTVFLREYSQAPLSAEELELFDDYTLMQMWFANHRIYIAQKEDVEPKGAADLTSIFSPMMSSRIEDILNRRGVYPALELDRQERQVEGSISSAIETYTIVFEWDGMPKTGSGPVAAISCVNGVFPSILQNPLDSEGASIVGEWEYDSVDVPRKLVVYHRRNVSDSPNPS